MCVDVSVYNSKRGVVVELGLINKAGARSGCQSD